MVYPAESHETIVENLSTERAKRGDTIGTHMVGAIEGMITLEQER